MAGKADNVTTFPTKKPDYSVLAWENTSLFSSKEFPRYNPDSLVQRKGLGIYAQMLVDEQVKAAYTFKRDAITSRDWIIKWPKDVKLSEDEQQRRTNIYEKMLRYIRGSFTDKLNHILSGIAYGFSITEKIYGIFEYEGRPYNGIVELLSKDPSTFWFYTDDWGLLDDFRQKISGKEQSLDLRKFVHYVHAPEEDEWYGRSDFRSAYRSWFAKDIMLKYWLIWGERMAGGFVKGTRTPDATITAGTPEWEELKKVITNIKTVSGVLLPTGIDLELVMPGSTDAFEKAITFHDLCIAKSMLVPNLLGVSHTGQTGAYSQSQTQLEAFFWTLNATSNRLASCITEQVFKDADTMLFGDNQCPEFCFKPASQEYIKWIITSWKELVAAKAITTTPQDEEHLRKILEMPELTVEEIEEAQAAAHEKEMELVKKPETVGADGEKKPPKEEVAPVKKRPVEKETYVRKKRAENRVAFAVIGTRSEDITVSGVDDLARLVALSTERIIEPERVQEYLADPKLIEAIVFESPDISKLKSAAKRALDAGWKLGQKHAGDEIGLAQRKEFKANFARLGNRAAEYLETQGFKMAKNLTDGARGIIQTALQNGLKYDRTAAEIRTDIYDSLIRKGFTDMKSVKGASIEDVAEALEEALGGEQGVRAYLNTLVRTNTFEAINEARYSLFTDPMLEGFVEALAYSAVLDESTTEICAELDGNIYAVDSPVWTEEGLRPPNHYNCRSTLVAITAADGWDGEEDDPPAVEPQAGFA